MSEASAILALAHRDFTKLLRDRQRMVADFAFPLIFIGILGTSLQAGLGGQAGGINLLDYVFTGVLAQTVWLSVGARTHLSLGTASRISARRSSFRRSSLLDLSGRSLASRSSRWPQALAIIAFGFILRSTWTRTSLSDGAGHGGDRSYSAERSA